MKNFKENAWQSLERKWKETMDSNEELVNPALWNKISQKLDQHTELRHPNVKKSSKVHWALAAMLFIALGITWQQFNPQLNDSKSDVNSLNKRIILKPVAPSFALIPSNKKVQQKEKHRLSSKSIIIKKSLQNIQLESFTNITIPEEKIMIEARDHIKDENMELKDDVIWVRVDIKPIEQKASTDLELKSNFETEPIREKVKFRDLVRQLRHLLKGEFQELKLNQPNDVFIEDKIHQVANQYIKTGEIIKQKFQ